MASDAKAMPLTLLAADLLDRLATAYADLEPGPYTDRDGMIGSARRLAASLRQDYTPPAPDAGSGAGLEDALAEYATTMYLSSDTGVPGYAAWILNERDAARARVLALYADAVQAADAAGYARAMVAMRVVAAPFIGCHDPKPPNMTRRCCNYYGDERDGDCNGCKLWRALGGDAFEDATTPALVNGGPPTDALDDGR